MGGPALQAIGSRRSGTRLNSWAGARRTGPLPSCLLHIHITIFMHPLPCTKAPVFPSCFVSALFLHVCLLLHTDFCPNVHAYCAHTSLFFMHGNHTTFLCSLFEVCGSWNCLLSFQWHKSTVKQYSKTAKCCYSTLLKIKFPKGGFCRNAVEEPFSVPQRYFQWTVLRRNMFFLVWRTF